MQDVRVGQEPGSLDEPGFVRHRHQVIQRSMPAIALPPERQRCGRGYPAMGPSGIERPVARAFRDRLARLGGRQAALISVPPRMKRSSPNTAEICRCPPRAST